METALFTNFSSEPFIGYWNGKGKRFEPGQSLYMPDYLAKHFAKHLANRELLRMGLEKDTSPKIKIRPDGTEYVDNIRFTEMFNKAYTVDGEVANPDRDSIDVQIEVANRNRAEKKSEPATIGKEEGMENLKRDSNEPQDPTQPQIIDVPDDDEDENEFPEA